MKRFINCLFINIKYMVFSYRFLFSCIAFVIISIFSIMEEAHSYQGCSVYYLYCVYLYYPYWLLFLLFGVIPGGAGFCTDRENRYVCFCILRSGKKIYAVSKSIACFISAVLLVFFSQWIFILLLRLRGLWCLETDSTSMIGSVFEPFINHEGIWIYFLIRITILAFSAGFFSLLALWISTKINNIFVVLASPIILYYLIENLTAALKLPIFLSIPRIIRGTVEITKGPWETLMFAISLFTILALVLIAACYFSCKRGIENE